MLIVEPLLRLPEAILRMLFLSDYYGSFWNAVIQDWFFSEGWFAYIKTPLGLSYTIFMFIWTLTALAFIALAFWSWRKESKQINADIEELVEQAARSNGEQPTAPHH